MSDSPPDRHADFASPTHARPPSTQNGTQNPTSKSNGAAKPTSPTAPYLNPRSCVTCRKRKVRCDKKHPCSNCTKAGIECLFPGPGRAPRKSRKPPDTELLVRLRRLEGVVQTLGAQVDEDGNAQSPATTTDGSALGARVELSEEQRNSYCDADPKKLKKKSLDKEFGRLVIDEGRSRYVSNQFWASLSDEVAEMRDILDEPSSDEEDYPSPEQSGSGSSHHSHPHNAGFIFGYSSLSNSLRNLHPSPSQVFTLWEIYKENVDPVVKILHRPSMRRWLLDVSGSLDNLNKSVEAMLFSIYHAAVTSMNPSQCLSLLGEERDALLVKYRYAVEQSLARAGFLNSASLMLLQAFVLFLICVRRHDDTRFVWTLSGLAIRLAQSLGIHRDGSNFGLSPFETEMRRRLWWHICILDVRSSEDHGTDPSIFEQFYDSRLPLNINDEDISPETTISPTERVGCTEMTFCLIRFEVSVTVRRLTYIPPGAGPCNAHASGQTLQDKERLIDALHKRLEERYLQYCDMSVPIYWVTATVARLIMAKMWLVVHHPLQRQDRGASLPQDTRDRLFLTSVEVIEFSRLLETHESTEKWGWLFRTYMQWHAVAFVLSELCVRPRSPAVERAWRAVESVYDGWDSSSGSGKRGMLWRPMRKLMAKARSVRAQQARVHNKNAPVFPKDGSIGPHYPSQSTTLDGVYPVLDAHLNAFDIDPMIDPADSAKPSPLNPKAPPPSSKSPLSVQPGPPPRSLSTSNAQPDLTPATRNFSDDDINQWLVQEQRLPGDVGSNLNQDPVADLADLDPNMSQMGNRTGSSDGGMDLDWTGWDQAVKDFQMDMQQAQRAEADGMGVSGPAGYTNPLVGPAMGDITDVCFSSSRNFSLLDLFSLEKC